MLGPGIVDLGPGKWVSISRAMCAIVLIVHAPPRASPA